MVLRFAFFAQFPCGPLLLLEPVFLVRCLFDVTVLESALVWSPTGVCRRHRLLQPRGEVVQLDTEVVHAIHIIPLFLIRCLAVDQLFRRFIQFSVLVKLIGQKLRQEDLSTPLAMDLIEHPPLFRLSWHFFRYLSFAFLVFA